MPAPKERSRSTIQAMSSSRPARPPRRVGARVLTLEGLETREVPATLLWAGNSGQNDWSVATSWTVIVADPGGTPAGQRSDHAPGAGDVAKFTDASTQNCNVNAPTQVGSLLIDGYPNTNHLTLNQSLTVGGGQLSTTTANSAQYAIGGGGDLIINSGTFTWTSGTMAGTTTAGRTVVNPGATLVIASSTTNAQDARLAGRELTTAAAAGATPAGIVNFTSGQIFCQGDPVGGARPAAFTNSGQFNVSGTASSILAAPPIKFTNTTTGTVTVGLNTAGSLFKMQPAFDNNNTSAVGGVQVTQGQMKLTGGGSSLGTWMVFPAQNLLFAQDPASPAPQFTWGAGTQFFGTGWVVISSATVTLSDGISVSSDARLFFFAGTLKSAPGFNRPALVSKSEFDWTDGSTNGLGTIQITAGSKLYIFGSNGSGNSPALDGWTIENNGDAAIGNAPGLNPAIQPARIDFKMGNGAQFNNNGVGTITFYDTSNILTSGGLLGTIKGNAGSLIKAENSGSSSLQVKFNGLGGFLADVKPGATLRQLDAGGGEINRVDVPAAQPKKMSFLGPFNFDTTLAISAGGSVSGVGTITTALLQSDGAVEPGDNDGVVDIGLITVNGNYTQTANGALDIDLASASNDRLQVAGAISLSGTLNVNPLWSSPPAIGTRFTIIQNDGAGSVSGTFNGLPDGAMFAVGGEWMKITYTRPSADIWGNAQDTNDVILECMGGGSGGMIEGVAWNDLNDDGARETGEPNLTTASVTVKLIDDQNRVVATTTTDATGAYSFGWNVFGAGTFAVEFVAPSGGAITTPSGGRTAPFQVAVNQVVDVDVGVFGFGGGSGGSGG